MRKILLFLLAFLIGVLGFKFLTTPASAQVSGLTPSSSSAQVLKVTYPLDIPNVGTCDNKGKCRELCEDPVNREGCVAWAKGKGFYKSDLLETKKDEVIAAAKNKFGCDSENSCRQFCDSPSNYALCSEFAKSVGLHGGYMVPPKTEDNRKPLAAYVGLESVKIGGQECSSLSCVKEACDKVTNANECTVLAQKAGLRGGVQKLGPGGCTSAKTCKEYCNDPTKADSCASFGFKGPGGCDSENSCVDYCKKNPGKCSFYKESDFKKDNLKQQLDPNAIGKYCEELAKIKANNTVSTDQMMKNCLIYMKNRIERNPGVSPMPGALKTEGTVPFQKIPYSPKPGYLPVQSPLYSPNSKTYYQSPSSTTFSGAGGSVNTQNTTGLAASPSPTSSQTSGGTTSGGGTGTTTSATPTPTTATTTTTTTTTTTGSTNLTNSTTTLPTASPTVRGVKTVAGFFQAFFGFLFGR